MAATTTPNYGWVQPMVGGDATTWGNELNNDLALIDAQVYANEQATVMIGCITMYGGATPPTNWLLCNGQSLATVGTYAGLFAVIGYTYGGAGANFNVPNLQAAFAIGAGSGVALGAIGGASSTTLATAQLPAHSHSITDVAHNHGINQSPHAHPDGTHSHTASGSQDPHNHTVSPVQPGYGIGATYPPEGMAASGSMTTSTAQPNVYVAVNASGANIGAADANISLNASGTGLSTTNATGSGSPVPTVPPFQAVSFIIRYQ